LMNAAPLMQRILSDATLPEWHRSPKEVKEMQPKLLALCQQHGIRLSDVALRYAMDHPQIATTIIGMYEVAVVKQNLAASTLEIHQNRLREIEQLIEDVKNRKWFEVK